MVFAHQGGWDEMLLVLGPILVIVLLLRLARNRAIKTTDETPVDHDHDPD
jgi:hypothetical protein